MQYLDVAPVAELKESGFLSCPQRSKDEKHKRWREEWLGELKKTRELDEDFRRQINQEKIFTCEKHFYLKDIEIWA